ncbi:MULTISPECIES: hypothetical protein [Paraburkholderia]|uniref:hypothetical protein n=1 Tax=Paraburkholderia TaxID=1822464 RepID=UPI001CAE9183|nr:hypothetical protein [Paraburkholderia caribensis]CAG9248038.1 conserved hypothetical protein [Paraburkholderia caribensis]
MNTNTIDYEALTLVMEKRIATHLKAAKKKRSRLEESERVFFAAAANEALFVWMLLASRMNSDLYQADKARLIRMVEDVTPDCTQAADAQFHPKPVAAA